MLVRPDTDNIRGRTADQEHHRRTVARRLAKHVEVQYRVDYG